VTGKRRWRRLHNTSSVNHLKISASHAYEASLVSAILRYFVLPSLSQVTLDLDLEEMHFPISYNSDWGIGVWTLLDLFPSLTQVDVTFRSCPSDITEEKKDILRGGMLFLKACDEHGILHTTFISK
jgi:hypothetical protein